jgi:hypothetical protein
MSEKPMITNRGAQSAERGNAERDQKNLEAGNRIQNQTDNRENVDEHQVSQNSPFSFRWFPKRLFPRTDYTKSGLIHESSNMSACTPDSSKLLRRREIPLPLYTS